MPYSMYQYADRGLLTDDTVLFNTVEEAWFWYCACQAQRDQGRRVISCRTLVHRPCDPDDIYCAVVKLALANKISKRHIQTLVQYGPLFVAPNPSDPDQSNDALWWDEAMDKLSILLRLKGIVL